MLCDSCRKGHATYEHPIFVGTKMVRVHLCNDCFTSKNAETHLNKIKTTKDHVQKTAAVEEFLKVIGKKY
jgi:protein-arginine kinase activator protein McsA